MANQTIAIIGAGSFGTALCFLLGQNSAAGGQTAASEHLGGEHPVGNDTIGGRATNGHAAKINLWCHSQNDAQVINETGRNPKHFCSVHLQNTEAYDNLDACVQDVDACILAVPSFALGQICTSLKGKISDDLPIVILSKGLDPKTGKLLPELAAEILGNSSRIAALAGPNHAEELIKKEYAGAVVACANEDCASYFQKLISNDFFRIYTSNDVVGVSLCAASKNVIAIACGVARGLGCGDNTIALLITRGIAEIRRLVSACGGNDQTCMGLAGIGDLNVTCCSPHSRNGSFGEKLASGVKVQDYERKNHVVVEGAHNVNALLKLARANKIEMPIMQTVKKLLDGKIDVNKAIENLIKRQLKAEF